MSDEEVEDPRAEILSSCRAEGLECHVLGLSKELASCLSSALSSAHPPTFPGRQV